MKGFLHQNGTQIFDGNDKPVYLRGVGLANWLLPEGYMWKFFDQCDSPRRIERLIAGLLGEDAAAAFWQKYYASYISRADMQFIKNCGLNSIRLPVNARCLMQGEAGKRQLNKEGIRYIDDLLFWCAEFGIYAILDMHAAPGGQTGTNIDDSENRRPELFENPQCREDILWLWRELARRYADNPWIAGYDLLNEPLPDWFAQYNGRVLPLFRDIVDAIREVDANHMVILEGVHWATDWSIFDPLKERPIENCMLQFHKYWSNPDTESLKEYLHMRELLHCPIYMGEGGENNLSWYAGMFHLLEQHKIGWNFWSYKKMNTHNSFVSFHEPERWAEIIAYAGGGNKPADAEEILNELIRNIRFENCSVRDDAIRHVMRTAPLRIPAVYYDLQPAISQKKRACIVPLRQEDGADIRFVCGEEGELCFKQYSGEELDEKQKLFLFVHEGERFEYTFHANGEPVALYCGSSNNGCIRAGINGRNLGRYNVMEKMYNLRLGESETGKNLLSLTSEFGGVEIQWIQIG